MEVSTSTQRTQYSPFFVRYSEEIGTQSLPVLGILEKLGLGNLGFLLVIKRRYESVVDAVL